MIKTQLRNTLIMVVLAVALVFGIGAATKKEVLKYTPGDYYGVATGKEEGLWVKVTVTEDAIKQVEIVEHHETPGYCEPAMEQIPVKIITANSPYVDTVSGATKTSEGIKNAVVSCIYQAAGKEPILDPPEKKIPVPLDYSYNPGVYSASAEGFEQTIKVEVEFSETAIVKVTILNSEDGEERVKEVKEGGLIDDIIEWQTYDVDTVSGASWTSKGVMDAVQKCVEQAKK